MKQIINSNQHKMEESYNMGLSKVALQNEANNSSCYITYPVWQFRPGMIVEYDQKEWTNQLKLEKLSENLELAKETYRGDITTAGRKRIRRIMEVWLHGIQLHNKNENSLGSRNYRKLVFITTTLSSTQIHGDKQVKEQVLKSFMRILRERYGCDNYIWKAEIQGNGNLHFHIAIDKYVQKDVIQHIWNECQEKLGYISSFEKRYKHRNPPSTNVQAILSNKALNNYLSKYLGKSEGKRSIEGAIWKSSKSLNSLTYFSCERDTICQEKLTKKMKDGKVRISTLDHCNCLYISDLVYISMLSKNAVQYYVSYCVMLRTHLFSNNYEQGFSSELVNNNRLISRALLGKDYEIKGRSTERSKAKKKQLLLFECDKAVNTAKFKD